MGITVCAIFQIVSILTATLVTMCNSTTVSPTAVSTPEDFMSGVSENFTLTKTDITIIADKMKIFAVHNLTMLHELIGYTTHFLENPDDLYMFVNSTGYAVEQLEEFMMRAGKCAMDTALQYVKEVNIDLNAFNDDIWLYW